VTRQADGNGDAGVVEALLAQYIEARLSGAVGPDLAELCRERPDLLPALRDLAARYEEVEARLGSTDVDASAEPLRPAPPLPILAGFRTIERLGRGGAGEVYKVEDQTLGRVVAAKVLRSDSGLAASASDFLREARSLALFDDPRIVRLLEFRATEPPVLLMEYVDGFPLSEIGPSLEFAQRARIVAEAAEALQRAHELGLQHRDLKPTNILVDAGLRPRILDFGLSRGEPDRGHGLGTLEYMAPEQLDATQPIDHRTDVYGLGVVLFELLTGERPFQAESEEALAAAIRGGEPRLPTEVDPAVPEPLQAIALQAMATLPEDRYATARDMAADLHRYLEGRPVLARPPAYRSALDRRMRPHLDQIGEWQRLKLIYPHEARSLRSAYGRLESREGDWILGSRALSFSQISLYLGAFLLACGGLLYFVAYLEDAVKGLAHPLASLAVPFCALTGLAFRMDRGEHKPAAVAFHLGAAALLPLLLIVLVREAGLLSPAGTGRELFEKVSNRQLQVALLASSAWIGHLASRTRTVALASAFGASLTALHLAVLGDHGLRTWLDEGRWDALSVGLTPLLAFTFAFAVALERRGLRYFAQPLLLLAAGLFVTVLELVALDGRALAHLGVTLSGLQAAKVSDPTLLDTVAALTANGVLILLAGGMLDRHGTPLMKTPAFLLESISPFAILEPLAYLAKTGEYSRRVDWLFLALALAIVFASHFRQRRSFFTAGLLNTGLALALLTDHYEWLDEIGWAVTVLIAGGAALAAGLGLEVLEWRRRSPR
jgi:serine/threonine protein kinase